jgi:hypothetical protein
MSNPLYNRVIWLLAVVWGATSQIFAGVMNPDHCFECNAPDVVFENFGDEAVILNLQSGNYYSLDGVGMLYWHYLVQGVPHRQIAAKIGGGYTGAADQAAITKDLDEFLAQLQAEGLIRSSSGSPTSVEVTVATMKPSAEYTPPVLSRFDDVADMLLLDPVHDVSEGGWPHPAPAPGATGGENS